MDRESLGSKLLPELQKIAQTLGVEGGQKLRKAGLIDATVAAGNGAGNGNGATDTAQVPVPAPAASTPSEPARSDGAQGERVRRRAGPRQPRWGSRRPWGQRWRRPGRAG